MFDSFAARRFLSGLSAFAVAVGLSSFQRPAAALTQPGSGTLIPTDNELRDALAHLGESITPTVDAAVTPERFRPQCNLTFTVLERLTDYKNAFGWYNVTGSRPATTELYEFIHCSDPPNTWDASFTNQTSRTLDIRNDPRYLGGEIGFFQAVGKQDGTNCADVTRPETVNFVVFSETALNPDNAATTQTIHLLIMNSTVENNVFYFGWEDLLQGGDNDFSDLVLRVEGINCSGGGERCDTGLQGVCADGASRCENGVLVCSPRQMAGAERCNGLDDDCDGVVDDGDLCEARQICDRGRCIDACNTGEFACPITQICREDGYCVDPACAEVDCPPGQYCAGGSCVDLCGGVVCPFEEECRAGRCVDPCADIDCGEDQACRGGACVTTCECSGCDAGQTCLRERRLCVEDACETVSCAPGTHCAAGNCADDCAGAVCPRGQLCVAGACTEDPNNPGNGGGSSGGGPGIPIGAGSGGVPAMLPGSGGGAALTPGSGAGSSGVPRSSADSGCACRLATRGAGAELFGVLAGMCAAAALLLRRR